MNCEFCQSPVHIWFQCPKKPDGWKPARLAKKSTAARKDVREQLEPMAMVAGSKPAPSLLQEQVKVASKTTAAKAGTQALPVDTTNAESPNGRAADFESGSVGSTPASAPKFDKKTWQREYMREYMRKRRAALKS